MFIASNICNNIEPKEYTKVTKNIKDIIRTALSYMIEDKPIFSLEQFDLTFADECVTKTNVNEVGDMILYVELSCEANIKPKKFSNVSKNVDRNIIPDLNFTLEKFKKNLLQILLQMFDNTASFYETKYGIILKQAVEYKSGDIESYSVNIIPALSYMNESGKQGVLFYDDYKREVEIRYPKLYIKNFKAKDKETSGLYSKYCIIVKNLFLQSSKEELIPTEIFDTIMYNVPSNLYSSIEYQDIAKVVNFIRNMNVNTIKTIDEQDFAFTSSLRSMSYLYAKNAIKHIGKGLNMMK